jgi:hypothetical protein
MKQTPWMSLVLATGLIAPNTFAYEVWMGTHSITHSSAANPAPWAHAASRVEGLNINRAPSATDPATTADWKTILPRFTNAAENFVPCARSNPTRDLTRTNALLFPDLTNWVTEAFATASNFGYTIRNIMFYDNAIDTNKYNWTTTEVQQLRNILDGMGQANVGLINDARNNGAVVRNWCANPLVDHVLIEANANAWLINEHSQQDLLQWLATNSATSGKRIILQIPGSGNPSTQFAATREVVQMLGSRPSPLGWNFLRGSRVVFLPCNYNLGEPGQFSFDPETVPGNGALYTNTLTGLCLSLLEQRDLFEGRLANLPTVVDADSYVRNSPPDLSNIPDQELNVGEATGALQFTVDDEEQTPANSLVVTRASSNTNLVPTANVVLDGSGSNRTVTVTPAPGQTGIATISLMVSDGTYSTTNTFTVTVMNSLSGTLLGTTNDAGIKEDLAIEHLADATADVGSRGSSPYVERCVVYVFELPAWGSVTNPFTSASFRFNCISKNSTLRSYDLYGLGRRASGAVLAGDYYATNAVADPTDATRLQTGILDNGTATGLVTTSPGGDDNLLAFLNGQYAAGAGAGQYVFLRLNTTTPKSGISYATVTMSEGGVEAPTDTRPRIDFIAIPPNTAPKLAAITNRTLIAGQTLTLTNTASDTDLPAQTLVFSLLDPPAGAAITAHSGVFTWRPAIAQSPSTNSIRMKVADNGSPSLSATNTFTVTVSQPAKPVISGAGWSNGQFSFTIAGASGPDYIVLSSTNLVNWSPLWTNYSPILPFTFTNDTTSFMQRFYRAILGP